MSSNLKLIVDETSSLLLKMWTRPAAYYELLKSKMMNNQVGDNYYSTSVQILTLFAEATRMPHSSVPPFSPKLLREATNTSSILSNNSWQWYFPLFRVSSVTTKFEMPWLLYMLLEFLTNQNGNMSCCGLG